MTASRTRARVLSSLLVLALGLGLAACGSSSDSSDDGGSQGTQQRGSDPDSPYCQRVLADLEGDADGAAVIEGQAELAPDELADAYAVLAEHPDLLDAWDTLDESQREPIADEVAQVVTYQVHTCGVDISGG